MTNGTKKEIHTMETEGLTGADTLLRVPVDRVIRR